MTTANKTDIKVILTSEAQQKLSKVKRVNFDKIVSNIEQNNATMGNYGKFGIAFEKLGKLIILL